MSYSSPQETRRPGVVTAAAFLMLLVAVLELVYQVVALSTLNKVIDATKLAYVASPNAGSMVSITRISAIGGAVLGLLIAAGYVVGGLLDLRGKNGGRITSWVFAGLGVLCFGCGAIGVAGSGALTSMQKGSVNGVDIQEATRQINAAIPAWVRPVSLTIVLVNLIASILAIVLLALPAANGYFRRARQISEPAIPTMPYPPAPGAPPGYPPAPGTAPPGYPPAPGDQPGPPPPGQPPA